MRKYLIAASALALFAADASACGRIAARLRHPFGGRFSRRATVASYSSYSSTTYNSGTIMVAPACSTIQTLPVK